MQRESDVRWESLQRESDARWESLQRWWELLQYESNAQWESSRREADAWWEANEWLHQADDAQRKADASREKPVVAAAPERRHQPEGAPEGGAFEEDRRHIAVSLEPGAYWQGTSPPPSVETSPSPGPTSSLSALLSTPLGEDYAAWAPPQHTASSPSRSSTPVDHVAVARRARPRRRTGRRNRPRAPSPLDEGLPSHPIQQQGGALKPTPTALARATLLPSRSAVSHQLTTPPPPTLLPHNTAGVDVGVLAMSSGGGGAHPFLERGPTPPRQRKRTRRKRRPLRVYRRHGPRAPDHADSLLLGRRHRPRAPNQSTRNGWA